MERPERQHYAISRLNRETWLAVPWREQFLILCGPAGQVLNGVNTVT